MQLRYSVFTVIAVKLFSVRVSDDAHVDAC